MITALLGTKQIQTQTFTDDGRRISVTVISAGPCWITQKTDSHVQLGFQEAKRLTKAQEGHIKKAGLEKKLRFLRSFPIKNEQDVADIALGQQVSVDNVFQPGDAISVTGISKGKGFAGVVKRHGFRGGPRTHGQSDRERAPGSIGQTTTPGRVYKGKRMAGRMGNDQVTVRGLTVVSVDASTNTLTVKGLVPGGKNGLLIIQKAH